MTTDERIAYLWKHFDNDVYYGPDMLWALTELKRARAALREIKKISTCDGFAGAGRKLIQEIIQEALKDE